jgi:hypothetical protein
MAGLDPAIPMLKGAAFHTIGITGTRPVMTLEGTRAGDDVEGEIRPGDNVLTLFLTLCCTQAREWP